MLNKLILTAALGCFVCASGAAMAHSEEAMEREELASKLQRKLSLSPELADDLLDVKVVDGKLIIVGQVNKLEDRNAITRIVSDMKLDVEVVDKVALL